MSFAGHTTAGQLRPAKSLAPHRKQPSPRCLENGRILLANSMLPLRPRLEGRPAALGYKAQADQSRSVAANSVSPEANSPTVSDRFLYRMAQRPLERSTNMTRIGGFRSFNTARRAIQGFEAMLWLRKGFGFAGAWTVREQNRLLALCFGLPVANKA